MNKTTYKLRNCHLTQRLALGEEFGGRIDLENLGDGFWNVICDDEDAKEISAFLDVLGVDYAPCG